ncbi:TonB-dependent siderophore receptor [Kordiimonas sp. SCSIO 12610]|uniref:TonB-dependent receptor plug domain-containing protein n=1 Tax=Kordiimonas sp. SCSIO 12610 TaxID=2829597 RepID=UPI00210EF30F|nr:TonB-dependent receptor [Kordiimonas sp. SCSIO 12610]UTW55927.1 TonB-dependent receptor [Kordiimonas sp. SCSIO 12610]
MAKLAKSLKIRNSLKIALLTSVVGVPSVFADDDVEEIVITANRREQPISDVGKSISVLTEEALALQQFNFVVDALQTVPGVSINQNGTFGGLASVSIRGNASDQTVILIDGVQVNDPSSSGGGFNFSTIDPVSIERIEVVRGPQSVLYGSDAIGGVVNIITKSGGEGFGGSVVGEYGSFSSFRTAANVFGGDEKLGFNLAGSYLNTDGISAADSADGNTEDDGFENLTLRARITSKFNDIFSAEITSSYVDSENEFDSFGLRADGNFGVVDGDEVANSEEFLIAGRAFADFLDGRFTNTFSIEYSRIDRQNLANGVESFAADGERFNLDYIGSFQIDDNWSLSGGAQREVTDTSVDPDDASINSVFGLVEYNGLDGLNLTAGIRVDDTDRFGSVTSAQFSGSYTFEDTGTRIIASWGEGFKAPTIFQRTFILTDFTTGEVIAGPNANLLAESSEAFEVGVEQSLFDDQLRASVTYFDQDVDNLIGFSFTVGFDNISEARSRGIEFTLDGNLTDTLSFTTNYTYVSARDVTDDRRLARRPRHQAFGNVQWQVTDKFQTNVSVTYNGSEINNINNQAELVDDWIRVDLRASYQLTENLELFGRIDNLFDEEYQQVLDFGTPGASVFGGVRATF